MKQHNKSLLNQINYYDVLFANDVDPILFIVGTEFIDCNEAALKILKMSSKEDLYNIHPSQISPKYQPDGKLSSQKADELIEYVYENGFSRFEWVHKNIHNEDFWVEVTLKKLDINKEAILYVSWRDISKRKRKEQKIRNQNIELRNKNNYIHKINSILKNADRSNSNLLDTVLLLEEYKKAIDESSIVSKTDRKGIITYVNDNFCKISGYTKEELLGQNHNIIRNPEIPKSFFQKLWETINDKRIFKGVISNRKKDGSIYYVDSTIVPILNNEGEISEFIGIRNDITSLYEKDLIISNQITDDLTQLPNRQKLINDLEDCIEPKLALVNINHFKDINDAYGIKAGDLILKDFAQRLKELNSYNIKVYRIGGDVFGILAFGNYDLEQLKTLCSTFIIDLNQNCLTYDNNDLSLSLSIGITIGNEWLLPQAEMALMQAKDNNESIIVFDSLEESALLLDQNVQLTKDIKASIQNNDILLFGQKIRNNTTGEIKYEVLMRMRTQEGKILSPYFFLEHAKKAKLYDTMTRIIIKKACDYFSNTNTPFSLNLTLQDITNTKTTQFLIDTLLETKTNHQVILEIVESEGIEKFEVVSEFIQKVKQIGCKIAIDDFGTGYSNFEYIIKLNVDFLKIDGSLIKTIHTDKNMYITVSAIVSFAKSLGIEVVAEFVHNKEVLEVIQELGIEHAQGFYLHEPEELIPS